MNIHEYQAKQLFSDYAIPVPKGVAIENVQQVKDATQQLGGQRWVVKAQVHAGGRGKAGGVKLTDGLDETTQFSRSLLGSRLVTNQSDSKGLPIDRLLIESTSAIERELYLGLLVDRSCERVIFMASIAGGMDIEEVAAETPEKLISIAVDPTVGLQAYQCRTIAFALQLVGQQFTMLSDLMHNLYRLFLENDASQIEINPLAVTENGELVAIDAKINFDDNALFAHPSIEALRDDAQEDEKERAARQFDLNYVTLEGEIGCMVNGAGLAMATMDLVKLSGGKPANVLDVGGGATAERTAEAFKLILSDHNVKAILVNIFGGIVRCDMIADGIIQAVKEVGVTIPVIVRLEGTNAESGRERLQQSGLNIIAANDLAEAAEQAVAAAR